MKSRQLSNKSRNVIENKRSYLFNVVSDAGDQSSLSLGSDDMKIKCRPRLAGPAVQRRHRNSASAQMVKPGAASTHGAGYNGDIDPMLEHRKEA